jgi:hypothetical protein
MHRRPDIAAHIDRSYRKPHCQRSATGYGSRALPALCLLITLPLFARETPPTVVAGTRLRVKFDPTAGTAISRVGDGVSVHLLEPVEAEGREVLPIGTILRGRVLAVRKGDKKTKSYPMIRLGFEEGQLPDGWIFPVSASLADLGVSEHVDSEGVATTDRPSRGEDIGVAAGSAGAGAGAVLSRQQ